MEINGMTFKRNLEFISWTAILFSIPLIAFTSMLIIGYHNTGQLQWHRAVSILAVPFLMICIFTVPGLILHYLYYKRDKGKSLKFGPTYFEIAQGGQLNKIYYKDILRVEKYHPIWGHRNPWSNYGFIRIILKNNLNFSYSCLTHDIVSSAIFFKIKEVAVEDCEVFYPS